MMFFSGIPCKVIVFWGWHGNHWIRSCHGISFKELLGEVAQYVLWSEATSFPWFLSLGTSLWLKGAGFGMCMITARKFFQ